MTLLSTTLKGIGSAGIGLGVAMYAWAWRVMFQYSGALSQNGFVCDAIVKQFMWQTGYVWLIPVGLVMFIGSIFVE